MGARGILWLAGLVAVAVGASLLFTPVAFRQGLGIELASDASLLSETRSPGAALLAAGSMILLGAYQRRYRRAAALTSALLFSSFGLARLVGLVLDGVPHDALVVALSAELALGVLSFWAWNRTPAVAQS